MLPGRGCRGWVEGGALLLVLAFGNVSVASGASSGLEFDPPAFNFGAVPYGSGPTEPHEVTLTNSGPVQLTIKSWRSRWGSFWPETPDPFGVASSDCHILEPGESCSIGVVFDPIHPGAWKGWARVRSQYEEEPWAELELSGEGTGSWVPATPQQVVFGSL